MKDSTLNALQAVIRGLLLCAVIGLSLLASAFAQESGESMTLGTPPILKAPPTRTMPQMRIGPTLHESRYLNSRERDNNPIISADGTVLFFNSTRKGDRPWARYDTARNRYDDDIYYSRRQPSADGGYERWSPPVNLGAEINTSQDDGIAAISPDGQTVYFVSLKRGWQIDGGPFYSAELHGTEWSNVQGMGGGITTFFVTHSSRWRFKVYGASISPDMRDFYFATTMASPTDNHQLWVSHKGDQQTWGLPSNLGPDVNAPEGSFAPCIAADNKTLYFASRRAGGYGGDDIYMTVQNDGKWGHPRNLGPAINSAFDESFPALSAAGDKLYLSTSGLSGNDDIFTAVLPEDMRPQHVTLLKGEISDKLNGHPVEATVVIEDLRTGKTIFNAFSNSATGSYSVVLQPGRDYGISVSAAGYLFTSDRFTIPYDLTTKQIVRDFRMETMQQGASYIINNIFFDYNDATVRPESYPELGRLVELLHDKPGLRIEIRGHTDNIGSREFNLNLSRQRAQAVRQYLMNTGAITGDRIKSFGLGMGVPAADNATDQGRKLNRRTELKILTM